MDEEKIASELASLPQWERDESSGGIVRNMEFPTFAEAIGFVNRVAVIADEHDHHPDIDIRYRRLKVVLVSHDVGGLSARDFRMAGLINDLADSGSNE